MGTKIEIGIIGYYPPTEDSAAGQSLRTISLTNELKRKYGDREVKIASTYRWKRNPVKFLFNCINICFKCKRVIIMPARNGLKIVLPICCVTRNILHFNLYYVVVGAWLYDIARNNSPLCRQLKTIDKIFVQTERLKNDLLSIGIDNTVIFPNFRRISIDENVVENASYHKPYPICFFSRVEKNKGIEDLIVALENVNKQEIKYMLDIYGSIQEDYISKFEELIAGKKYIKYVGVADGMKATQVLQKYYIQVLPTKYKTEGFPGSILDSFYAGVPVLVSKWNSCSDVVDDGVTGIVYEFDSISDLTSKLEKAFNEYDKVIKMKTYCLNEGKKYSPDRVMGYMYKVFDSV